MAKMRAPRNILGLFVTMPIGGAENLWLNIIRHLDRSRFNPITCCIQEKGVKGEEAQKSGFEVISLDKMRHKRFDFSIIRAIARIIKDKNVDIVHMHLYHAALYGRIASIIGVSPRPKTVVSTLNVYSRIKPLRVLANRTLARFTDLFIAGSEAVKSDVEKYDHAPADRVVVLPYGVEVESFAPMMPRGDAKRRLGLSRDALVLGTVGRLVEAKGQSYLLKACSLIKKRGLSPKVLVVGSGTLEHKLKKQARELGIGEDILFLGVRQDLPELFNAMDIYVMPSLWEGSPLALMSAMAAGLPCVVTRVGGMPDLLDEGSCGVIVPPKDEYAFSEALTVLIGDQGRRDILGERAMKRANELYGSGNMVRKLETLYEGLF